MLDPKCIYRKSIFAKCTRLACLLSFTSLFLMTAKVLLLIKKARCCFFLLNFILSYLRVQGSKFATTKKLCSGCSCSRVTLEAESVLPLWEPTPTLPVKQANNLANLDKFELSETALYYPVTLSVKCYFEAFMLFF